MKKIIVIFYALLLISCSQHDDLVNNDAIDNGAVVSFTSATPATRVAGNVWEDADEIGIFANETDMNKKFVIENVSTGQMVAATGNDNVSFSGETSNYYAYYPYTTTLVGTTYSVDVVNQSNLAAIDLMWASALNTNAQNVEFQFEHQLVAIELNITAGDADLTGVAVELSGVNTSANFDVKTGELFAFDSAKLPLNIVVSEDTKSATSAIIAVPTNDLSAAKFTITLGGKDYIYTPNAVANGWEKGGKYTYNVTLNI